MRLLHVYKNPQRMIKDQNHKSTVADQPQDVTESSGNVNDIALTSSSAPCQPAKHHIS